MAPACEQTRVDASALPKVADRASASPNGPPDARMSLDELDARQALPLLPMMANHQKQNMRDHLLAVQEIVAAVAIEDFPSAARAAGRIGSSPSMAQMCTHMGAGVAGFTERALAFHQSADGIAAAALQNDGPAVLNALGKTLSACTACHAAYKQSVVDDSTWKRLTAPTRQVTAPDHASAPRSSD